MSSPVIATAGASGVFAVQAVTRSNTVQTSELMGCPARSLGFGRTHINRRTEPPLPCMSQLRERSVPRQITVVALSLPPSIRTIVTRSGNGERPLRKKAHPARTVSSAAASRGHHRRRGAAAGAGRGIVGGTPARCGGPRAARGVEAALLLPARPLAGRSPVLLYAGPQARRRLSDLPARSLPLR